MKKYGRFTEEQVLEKISELPRWAQEYIREKQVRAEELERQVQEFTDKQKPSDIAWQYLMDQEHYIPKNSHIKFYHDPPEAQHRASMEVYFRNVGKNGRVIEVQGTRQIHVEPRAANNIYIVMEGNQEFYAKAKEEKRNKEMS